MIEGARQEQTRPASRAGASQLARIRDLAERTLDDLNLELVHLLYRKEGYRWVVRLFIDAEGGVSLDDCSRASHQFGVLLEAAEIIPHAYTLEVSSPGLDRPLFHENDYRRFAGRRACVKTAQPVEGRRHFTGTIMHCENQAVTLRLDGQREIAIPLAAILHGRLEIEWEQKDACFEPKSEAERAPDRRTAGDVKRIQE
ncbi:MAG: ribosome maturation factor RimP [Acidobacteriota bacterium]